MSNQMRNLLIVATCLVVIEADLLAFVSTTAADVSAIVEQTNELAHDNCSFDAVSEALCTLLAFGIAGAVIQSLKRRNARNAAVRVRQTPKCVTFDPCRSTSPTCASAVSDKAIALLARSSCIASTKTEVDALVVAVHAGRAAALPGLIDAARARLTAIGFDGAALQDFTEGALLSLLRACASDRCFRDALVAYDHVSGDISGGNGSIWSVLLYSAVESMEFGRCPKFWANLVTIVSPSSDDFVNMARYYAYCRDTSGLRQMLTDYFARGFQLGVIARNRALSSFVQSKAMELAEILAESAWGPMDVIGYNTVMKGYAHTGRSDRCMELYASLRSASIVPSQVTFGIILDTCINADEFEHANAVFEELRASSLALNVVHYTTFIKGLVKAGQLERASSVLDDMLQSPHTQPDIVTYTTLVKAYANRGKVMDAIRLLERMLNLQIVPDNALFNGVLTGCCVSPMRSEQIFHVFRWLSRNGLKTNTTTLSILVKALSVNQAWDAALELLKDASSTMGVVPEARLFAQLVQACAKGGHGERAIQVYAALARAAMICGVAVDMATNSRLHWLCSRCGMHDQASEVYDAIARTAAASDTSD